MSDEDADLAEDDPKVNWTRRLLRDTVTRKYNLYENFPKMIIPLSLVEHANVFAQPDLLG